MKKPKVTFVQTQQNASDYYRMYLPAKTLNENGWDIAAGVLDDKDFEEADILVFQRLRSEAAVRQILLFKKMGKKIIVDFDDNFFMLEDHNPAKQVYDRNALEWQSVVCRAADVLTVSTEPLAHSYAEHNSNIAVLPNQLDAATLNRQSVFSEGVKVGWQGTSTHIADLKIVKNLINDVSRRRDFEFVLAGFEPRGMFKKYHFRPWVNFSYELPYFDLIADFSIGLCPLTNSAFNESKSDIKFLEYSVFGIPTIATHIPAYDSIEHGVTGCLARNQSDWEKWLDRLILDEGARCEIGENAKAYVAAERTIQGNIHRWEEVLNAL